MVQYKINFANEYTMDVLNDLVKILDLDFVKEDLQRAIDERDNSSPNNVYILRGEDSCICLDCSDRDWLFGITILCQERDADQVKAALLKWDNVSREEYGQKLTEDIANVYGKKDTFLSWTEKFYNIKI